jgi:deazaflavin-dependent oxidoreductase (nitroreductase family)
MTSWVSVSLAIGILHCIGAASFAATTTAPPRPAAGGAGSRGAPRAWNGHTTAPFAGECQSFLDNVIAGSRQTGSGGTKGTTLRDTGLPVVAPKDPAWAHNLRVNPHIELRDETIVRPMHVREVKDALERARLWTLAVAAYPPYADYQARTERQIPVFVAEP